MVDFTESGTRHWAHLMCVEWLPELSWLIPRTRLGVVGIDKLEERFRILKCVICGKRKQGVCIQCGVKSCVRAFHVSCAYAAGLTMDRKIPSVENGTEVLIAYCPMHSSGDSNPLDIERVGMDFGTDGGRALNSRFEESEKKHSFTSKRNNKQQMDCADKKRRKIAKRSPLVVTPETTEASKAVEKIERYYFCELGKPISKLHENLNKLHLGHHIECIQNEGFDFNMTIGGALGFQVSTDSVNTIEHEEIIVQGEKTRTNCLRDQEFIFLKQETIQKYNLRGIAMGRGLLLWNILSLESTRFLHIPFVETINLELAVVLLSEFFQAVKFSGLVFFRVISKYRRLYEDAFPDAFPIDSDSGSSTIYFCSKLPCCKAVIPSPHSFTLARGDPQSDIVQCYSEKHVSLEFNYFDWLQSNALPDENSIEKEIVVCRESNSRLIKDLVDRIESRNVHYENCDEIAHPLNSTPAYDSDDVVCQLCASAESFHKNAIVICDSCDNGFHELCHPYPIDLKSDRWFCYKCSSS